ncbi:MAG: hypothetical protein AB3N14_10630 [Flavobacteriaceae bacterium]
MLPIIPLQALGNVKPAADAFQFFKIAEISEKGEKALQQHLLDVFPIGDTPSDVFELIREFSESSGMKARMEYYPNVLELLFEEYCDDKYILTGITFHFKNCQLNKVTIGSSVIYGNYESKKRFVVPRLPLVPR